MSFVFYLLYYAHFLSLGIKIDVSFTSRSLRFESFIIAGIGDNRYLKGNIDWG